MRATPIRKVPRGEIIRDRLGGLDVRRQGEGLSFEEMENLSVSKSPFLTTREKREKIAGSEGIHAILPLDYRSGGAIVRDALFCDFPTRLKAYKNGGFTDILSYRAARENRRLVQSGASLFIFPEKIEVDLMNYASSSPLECLQTLHLGNYEGWYYELTLTPCDIDGQVTATGDYTKIVRNCYTENRGEFVGAMAWNSGFSEGDFADFSGDPDFSGTKELVKITDGRTALVVPSAVEKTIASGELRLSRTLPEMDIVISAKNRLWGCRYGIDAGGKSVNAIYASALGDARNWKRFSGTASDSYAVSVGCGGAFTGAAVLDGCPVFFKKDRILKVAGDYPSRYALCEYTLPGAAEDAEGSVVRIGSAIYYKSPEGVMRWDGGAAVKTDAAIGGEKYSGGAAGRRKNCYCVSMEKEGETSLLVYDTEKKLWSREDSARALGFAEADGGAYLLTSEGLFLCGGEDKKLKWSFVTSPLSAEDGRSIAPAALKLLFMKRADGLRVKIGYDDSGVYSETALIDKRRDGTAFVRLTPKLCRSLRLKVEGVGPATLTGVHLIYNKRGRD